jgi:tetratricopeptide (TPR) repeat protein
MSSANHAGLLMLLMAIGGSAAAPGLALPPDRTEVARDDMVVWAQAVAAYDRGDCATAMKVVEPRLKQPLAKEAPEKLLAMGYDIAVGCAVRNGEGDVAYRYAVEGTALNDASDLIWRFRLATELQKQQYTPAVATIEALTQGRTAVLNGTPIRWLIDLSRELKDRHQDDDRRRLLKTLLENGYLPDDPFEPVDLFRHQYAEILFAAGDKPGATAQIREIVEPYLANQVSFDARFRSMLSPTFDVRASVERRLEEARSLMRQHPDQLAPIVQAGIRLRQLGRPQEALAVLETARPLIGREGAFTDVSTKLNWWWDGIASSHAMLGQYDEAVAAMKSGASAEEQGGINVSQLINLAGVQTRFGKPELALTTLAPFAASKRPVSPFGEMALRSTRGCANILAGRKDAAAADLAYAKAHEADGRRALAEIQLCMDDLDGAAATIIRQLEDPERRTATLVDLSDFDDPPVVIPVDPIEVNLKKVKARPDVQAAIARAGGTRRIHLQNVEL